MSNQLRGEILNAREVDLSGDLMRLQLLASSEIQDTLGADGSDSGGTPITARLGALAITGVAATFTMTLAAAGALFYDPTDVTLTADDSAFKLVRWVLQTLTFANPDGANPRIDLVVATPTMVSTDPQTRNILTDPTTRAFAPQTVNKTIKPQAVITVIPGTPGATPVPPALPAQKMAIAEVYVPAAAADATAFAVTPRIWRRAGFPWSTLSGVIAGPCRLLWDLSADPAVGSSTMLAPPATSTNPLRLLINGEVVEVTHIAGVSQDAGGNNPFGAAAPASHDLPYYIYAVGGRASPQNTGTGSARAPIAVVESLVFPLGNGVPSAAITPPRGAATTSAVLIGIGFVVANTTFRRACIMTDDMVLSMGSLELQNLTTTTASSSLASRPIWSSKVRADITFSTLAGGISPRILSLVMDEGDLAAPAPGMVGTLPSGFATVALASSTFQHVSGVILPVPARTGGGSSYWIHSSSADVGSLEVLGYNHGVKRIAGISLLV
jgi:hypothetical protein